MLSPRDDEQEDAAVVQQPVVAVAQPPRRIPADQIDMNVVLGPPDVARRLQPRPFFYLDAAGRRYVNPPPPMPQHGRNDPNGPPPVPGPRRNVYAVVGDPPPQQRRRNGPPEDPVPPRPPALQVAQQQQHLLHRERAPNFSGHFPRTVRQPLGAKTDIPFNVLIYESKSPAKFEYPAKFISEYCITYDRQLELGRMRAKKFHDRHLFSRSNSYSFNLNLGYETFDPKEGDEKLDMLLEWIKRMSPNGGRLKKVIHEADFVCWRGLLTKLSASIYNKDDGWKVKAIRRKGVIFLLEEKTEQAGQREANQTEQEKKMCYWGHKFEQYVTKDDDAEEPDTQSPVNTKEEYGVVFRNELLTDVNLQPDKRSLGILYSGEVDCIDKHGAMLELKTHKGQLAPGFWKTPKALKWWLQSSFVNVEHVVVGHRSHDGLVKWMTAVRTRELLDRGTWNHRACFEFTSTILTYIYNCLEKEGDACIVEYNSELGIHKGIQMNRVPAEVCDYVPDSFLERYT